MFESASRLRSVVLASVLAAGCGGGGGEREQPQPGAQPSGATSQPIQGPLSEADFKALHALSTDSVPALRGTMIDLAGTRAYLSLPATGVAPFPGVVVIQEWWGLNDHIKHWSDRLAAEGYAAIAPDLYEGKLATSADSAMAYVQAVRPERAVEILQAAHAFLGQDPRVRATRRGSLGWCFGGGYSLQLALNAPDLSAAIMYYGRPELDVERLRGLRAPLLGIFGNEDGSIPPDVVNQFDQALTQAGATHRILRYDAPHAFANPSNPHYDQEAAAQAWDEARAFLAAHLKRADTAAPH
jgi:carboxymethylenebutenolidase